jgi:hypothetical protein
MSPALPNWFYVYVLESKRNSSIYVIPQYRAQVNRSGLPSETLKCGSLESGGSAGSAEGAVLRAFTPWLIAKMCRFKFSPERPLRS